jgi:uncharacterized protein YfeS
MFGSKYVPYLDEPDQGPSPATSHPAFVEAAPDWFLAEDDPDAPFGNDDGHDTLRTLEAHFSVGGSDGHVPGCVANLIVEWDLVPEQIWESSAAEIVAWLEAEDAHIRYLHGEINLGIAAACGQFKISGWIHPALRFWAERDLMLLEHVVMPWERETSGEGTADPSRRIAATRAVIAAAPSPPRKYQLRQYAGLGG